MRLLWLCTFLTSATSCYCIKPGQCSTCHQVLRNTWRSSWNLMQRILNSSKFLGKMPRLTWILRIWKVVFLLWEPKSFRFNPRISMLLSGTAKCKEKIVSGGGNSILKIILQADDLGKISFLFAVSTRWQAELLQKYLLMLFLDYTPNIRSSPHGRDEKAFLSLILIKIDEAGCGLPVVFFFFFFQLRVLMTAVGRS